MKGPPKKHLSDFAVNFYSSRWIMLPSNQINSGNMIIDPEECEVANNCHIYLICQQPSQYFSRESFKFQDGILSGHIKYKIKDEEKEIPFRLEYPLLDGAKDVILTDYPHREINTVDEKGNIVRYLQASTFSAAYGMHLTNEDLRSLEVLYVGQAYAKGKHSALDRLKSHTTLQKILAEKQYQSPDYEVFILAFEYTDYNVLTHFDGFAKNTVQEPYTNKRFFSILDNPLTDYQQICLIEAALIRYFQPNYNKIYKNNFPSDKHKILEQLHSLDFSGLIVEVNTEELGFELYSENVKTDSHHTSKIDLTVHQNRLGFFHFFKEDGNVYSIPNTINSS